MRTIIEINNDSAMGMRNGGQEMADLLARALMLGSDAAWDRLQPFGINRIVEHHPTEPPKVVVCGR